MELLQHIPFIILIIWSLWMGLIFKTSGFFAHLIFKFIPVSVSFVGMIQIYNILFS